MKAYYVLFITALLAFSCNNVQQQPADTKNEPENKQLAKAETNERQQEEKQSSSYWEKLEMVAMNDSKGTVLSEMPLPTTWKMNKSGGAGTPSITGPNGIKVTNFPAQSFLYVSDPYMQQLYYQSGQQMRAMPSVEQLIQQDIEPWCAKKGLQLVRSYEVEDISKIDKWYSDQLYKVTPTRTEVFAIATEWKTTDGIPYLLLIHINASTSSDMQTWYYMCTGLEAETAHFEKAKKQYFFALANTRYNLEPIMAYNRLEAEKAGQSWAAHNQRMAQNQANFEAQQRAHVNNSNAINDAIMGSWNAKNASSDRQHEQFIDVITERTNVVNTNTGQQYKVSSGANQYWMNSDGEYIGVNKYDYNPNLDENLNRQSWQQLKEVKP